MDSPVARPTTARGSALLTIKRSSSRMTVTIAPGFNVSDDLAAGAPLHPQPIMGILPPLFMEFSASTYNAKYQYSHRWMRLLVYSTWKGFPVNIR
jgi:hypothetical protein